MQTPNTPQELADYCRQTVELYGRSPAFKAVAGNLVFMFPGILNFAVITKGAAPEFFTFDTKPSAEHDADFLILCDPELFSVVFGASPGDIGPYLDEGRIYISGDPEILGRFLKVGQSTGVLSTRLTNLN